MNGINIARAIPHVITSVVTAAAMTTIKPLCTYVSENVHFGPIPVEVIVMAPPVAKNWIVPMIGAAIIDGVRNVTSVFAPYKVHVATATIAGATYLAVTGHKRARLFLREWKGQPEVKEITTSKQYQAESVRIGSDETTLTANASQCRIGVMEGGKFVCLGAAIRFQNNWLVGPDHVLCNTTVDKYAYGSQGCVKLPSTQPKHLDTDLVAFELTSREFSSIGIKETSIGYLDQSRAFGFIVGPFGKGTTGIIADDHTVFGRITYTGTTMQGYSGAAYSVGPVVVGIHTNGGKVNGGFAASYIWMLLNDMKEVKDESSDEFILSQYKAGKAIKWIRSKTSPEEVWVQTDGKYHIMAVASLDKALGQGWQRDEIILDRPRRVFRDNEDHQESISHPSTSSGEAGASISPGGSISSGENQELAAQDHQDLMKQLRTLLNVSLNTQRTLRKTSKPPTPSTPGLMETQTN